MFKTLLLIAAGGAIGSVGRHGFNQFAAKLMGTDFPWGTMGVNIIGSLLIGVTVGLLAFATEWSQDVKAFAVVGILGGFTTFSAFSLDAILLWERGALVPLFGYILGSLVLSLAATFGGLALVRNLLA